MKLAEVKGMLKTCDRCGESIFLKTIGDGETDGGFTRWNKFEDAPEGWVYHSEPGTYAVTLCPKCNETFMSIYKDFMEGKSFTTY